MRDNLLRAVIAGLVLSVTVVLGGASVATAAPQDPIWGSVTLSADGPDEDPIWG